MTNIREQAALSAAGKALADNVEEGDKLSKVWSVAGIGLHSDTT